MSNKLNTTILNLGCGVKTSALALNIDWSIYLRIAKNPLLRFLVYPLLSKTRRERLQLLKGMDILPHNLAKGIPAADDSADMVYHSHMLEHLDREVAVEFLKEIYRVLKHGGIVRIVVPDLQILARNYLKSLELSMHDSNFTHSHDDCIADLYEQSVRREGVGTKNQNKWVRMIEKCFIGDARAKGETHQWMYDEINLKSKLLNVGFEHVTVHSFDTSSFPNWNEIGLDRENGKPYKSNSLYIEATKP